MRRFFRCSALVMVAVPLLAACGDDDVTTSMPMSDEMDDGGHMEHGEDAPSPVAADGREIEVTASSFAFDPGEITAAVGEELAIRLTSEDIAHDFVIDELDVHVAADEGDSQTGGLTAEEPGTYTYYCSVPGHREAGMEGTLVVS